MGLANQNELAPKGLVTLVIYPRPAVEASPIRALDAAPRRSVPGPPRGRIPWISSLLVFLLSAGVTFGAVYLRELWAGPALPAPRFLQAVPPGEGLGLRVEYEGERLLVTWSRTSPAVRSAAQGVLRIDDGGQHRDVLMDSTQVVVGSVLYKPASNDVTFRLEVQSNGGKSTVESIRVLDSGKPPVPTTSSEKPESNGSTASPPTAAPSSGESLAAKPMRPLAI
ncbi:MAG TPA: hypothetical protein VHU83_17645 [Bryobacteraceae bacterium]|jgi:hypothetical protein|nr:hypothetical protein [Bryobacteraceae bacterium]